MPDDPYPAPAHFPQPAPNPSGFPARRSDSAVQAGWSLGLSFVWLLPALIVSLCLGIGVLVSRKKGTGMAIAGICVSSLGLLASVVALVAGGVLVVDKIHRSEHRTSATSGQGATTSSGALSTHDLKVGDCFDQEAIPKGKVVKVLTVDARPCSAPHEWEVYHVFDLPDGPWPGDDQTDRLAEGGCVKAFPTFLGGAPRADGLHILRIHPLATSWALGDRTVKCMVGADDGTYTGTLRHHYGG